MKYAKQDIYAVYFAIQKLTALRIMTAVNDTVLFI